MTAQGPPNAAASGPAPPAGVIRRNLPAVLAAVGLTILVQVGLRLIARAALAEPAASAITLMGSLLWLVLAAPVFAAGGRSLLEGLLRGGAVADASLVVQIVVAVGGALTGWGVVKVYLLWAAVALAGAALAQQARRPRRRHVLAAAAAAGVLLLAAGPFWANGIVLAAETPWRGRLAGLVAAASGAYATGACLADAGFVWQERPVLYEYTVLSRDVPLRPPPWYATAAGFAAAAAVLAARAGLARRGR